MTNLSITTLKHPPYSISTPVFSGPLDLLLHLIERAELDITRLALAQVTNQFLAHLREISQSDAEEVSAFLVIAAKLLQIKSEMLLPRPLIREQGEEDPGQALAQQLRIYKRFKEISKLLQNREASNLRCFPRIAPVPKPEARLDLNGLKIDDLIFVAQIIFSKSNPKLELREVVGSPKVTIREKISLIANYLRRHTKASFYHLVSNKSLRIDIVVTFLALLELIKLHLVSVKQESNFGEILITPSESWDNTTNIEIEFGE